MIESMRIPLQTTLFIFIYRLLRLAVIEFVLLHAVKEAIGWR